MVLVDDKVPNHPLPRFAASFSGFGFIPCRGAACCAPSQQDRSRSTGCLSSRLLAFLQLRLLATANPGGRVTRWERFHGCFFNNVQHLVLGKRLARICRRRWCLLGMLRHSNPDSTPPRLRWDMPALRFPAPPRKCSNVAPQTFNPLPSQHLPVPFE